MEGLSEDIKVIRVNVCSDHVQLVMGMSPRVSVAEVIPFMRCRADEVSNERSDFIREAVCDQKDMGLSVCRISSIWFECQSNHEACGVSRLRRWREIETLVLIEGKRPAFVPGISPVTNLKVSSPNESLKGEWP